MIESPYPITCPPTIRDSALITFIGESPGGQEEAWHECPQCGQGLPYPGVCKRCAIPRISKPQGFVGGSGNLLRKACRNAGIQYDLCNRTNVVKRRPPGDDFGIFYLDKRAIQAYGRVGVVARTTAGRTQAISP